MNLTTRLARLEREVRARQEQDSIDIPRTIVDAKVMAMLTMIPPNQEDTIAARWWQALQERGLEDDGTSGERIAAIEHWYAAGCTYRKQ